MTVCRVWGNVCMTVYVGVWGNVCMTVCRCGEMCV